MGRHSVRREYKKGVSLGVEKFDLGHVDFEVCVLRSPRGRLGLKMDSVTIRVIV